MKSLQICRPSFARQEDLEPLVLLTEMTHGTCELLGLICSYECFTRWTYEYLCTFTLWLFQVLSDLPYATQAQTHKNIKLEN